ncbi:MAG: endolytic transglycosylase MltG [Bacteroidales bacterium]|nr:endolytic transglycosylase MltG [Bacteroidales bacterium]
MKKILLITGAILCLLGLLAAGSAYYILFAPNTQNTENVIVTVPRHATLADVMDAFDNQEILKNENTFGLAVKIMRFKTMRCGKYPVEADMDNYHLIRMLRAGQHYPVKFSFNNIRTMRQFVDHVGNRFFFEPKELASLLLDPDFLQKYNVTPATVPTLFIPNTYEIYYDVTPEEFVEKLHSYTNHFWNARRKALADSIGLTPAEVATLASIVEEENYRPAEKAIIAGLYINRLKKGMLLQSDPTVKYALHDFTRQRILNSDLQVDSPYNTYKYKGLPPGPIRIPEASTMDSVLHYRHHNYLYMCAKEDFSGYHNFTASAAEHSHNAARYRAALNKQNIKR